MACFDAEFDLGLFYLVSDLGVAYCCFECLLVSWVDLN